MPGRPKLTTTSYVVLGLVAARQPVTSYEMKRAVAQSIGHFWPFPHSQLYAEPARLTDLGLLEGELEASGRKRRRFSVTQAGREALARWLAEPTSVPTEIRDLGLLKLFFGGLTGAPDLVALAVEQRDADQRRRDDYEALQGAVGATATPWELTTLALGLRYEVMATEFWADVADRAERGVTLGEPAS